MFTCECDGDEGQIIFYGKLMVNSFRRADKMFPACAYGRMKTKKNLQKQV